MFAAAAAAGAAVVMVSRLPTVVAVTAAIDLVQGLAHVTHHLVLVPAADRKRKQPIMIIQYSTVLVLSSGPRLRTA